MTVSTMLTLIAITATAVTVFWRTRLNSPSEWRANYLAERAKTNDLEEELAHQRELKHAALAENAALRMATDLTQLMQTIAENHGAQTRLLERLEERLSKRMDAFSENQKQQTEVLAGLVDAVQRPVLKGAA